MDAMASRAHDVAKRCNAFASPITRRTIVPVAKQEEKFLRTAACPDS